MESSAGKGNVFHEVNVRNTRWVSPELLHYQTTPACPGPGVGFGVRYKSQQLLSLQCQLLQDVT